MASPTSLYEYILANAKARPQAEAILAPGRTALSYQALAGHLSGTVRRLNSWGIRPEDRVAVVLPNGPEMATAFLAVSAACSCAPLNPAYSVEEMTFGMRDLHVRLLSSRLAERHLPGRRRLRWACRC